MKSISIDQLIAVLGKEEADSLFLNPEWIKRQDYYEIQDIKYSVWEQVGRLKNQGDGVFVGDILLEGRAQNIMDYLSVVKELKGSLELPMNNLTSLKGCPKKIHKNFTCSHNELTSLEYGPEYVGGYYDCRYNKLTNLEYSPENIENSFNCENNKINTLKGSPKIIEGNAYFYGNEIDSLDHCPIIIGTASFLKNPITVNSNVKKVGRDLVIIPKGEN